MRVVVLGSEGMLGHKMVEVLREWYDSLRAFSRKDGLDAFDANSAMRLLSDFKPQVVVNCVGLIKQREMDLQTAFTVNSLFPHRLRIMCDYFGARLIHFSTDCVFSGSKGNYTETDMPDPVDIYGITKEVGEVCGAFALTLRTSIIGRELSNHKGLLEWFLRQHGEIQGHQNAIWSGVTTNYLSEAVAALIYERPTLSGLYQIASPAITKLHLLRLLKNAYAKHDVTILPTETPVCNRSLNGEKFESMTGFEIPELSEQIEMMVHQDGSRYDADVV